jgi:Ni/Co efflux regulator RcnB
MNRPTVLILAALIAAAPLSQAAAQDRGERNERQQSESRRPDSRQQDERRVSVGDAVQRASSGRQGRFLGASNRGDTIVVRWEYPGGRVADIMVDARSGRVVGER